MVASWDQALALFSGKLDSRQDVRALIEFLHSIGRGEAERVLLDSDDPEARLSRLLVHLDPELAPSFATTRSIARGCSRSPPRRLKASRRSTS